MQKKTLFWLFLLLLLTACHPESALLRTEKRAEQQLEQLKVMVAQLDEAGLRDLTLNEEEIFYFLFENRQLVYWSDNRLTTRNLRRFSYDRWEEISFDNARCMCRWTYVGPYEIMAAIPLEWSEIDREALEQSFSYQPLLNRDEPWWQSSRTRVRIFYILSLLLVAGLIFWGVMLLIRRRGFMNLSLSGKFRMVLVATAVATFAFVFISSVRYVRKHYENRQQIGLQQKAAYIQATLRNLYFWDLSLSDMNTRAMNIDLRDLAHVYGTDIHVFDMQGKLVGSSTPQLFEQGILSTHMAPEAFFGDEHTMTQMEQIGGKSYLSAYTEFLNGNYVPIGYIAVPSFISQDAKALEVDNFLGRLLPPYLLVLLVSVLLGVLAARVINAPLAALSESISSFRLGGQNRHLEYRYDDEVGQLVRRYNRMADELNEAARKIAASEREGAWRTMARQVAHEINNPLTPMKLTVQQLQRKRDSEQFDQLFDKACTMLVEQIDNLSRIAGGFSTFAKMPEVRASWVDVAAKLSQTISLMANNPAGIPLRYVGPDSGVMVWADADQVGQVFTNIIRNALQALSGVEDGDVIVVLRDREMRHAPSPEGWVEISVSDNGPGIPDDVQQKIFMPNFTTKSNGSGLGLAISKNIVEGSEGKICFETCEKGTIFFVYFKKKQ